MKDIFENSFCILIDYEKNTPNPSRIFKTMTDLIDAFQSLDYDLVKSIDSKIEPTLILEDIEIGSLKTYVSNILKELDDEGIKNIDWKPLVGKYLVKAKYLIINLLDGKTQITDKLEIDNTRQELLALAEETGIRQFPYYSPISSSDLISGIDKINKSLKHLDGADKASFITSENSATFNLQLEFAPKQIEDLLTKETIESTTTMILKVKKPDYLGDSKWDFKYDSHSIQVKILDSDWIKSFQNREVDIRPGDSIRASVKTEVKYGFDNEVVATNYYLISVVDVLPMVDFDQRQIEI
jgi:hypothetical protein